ncbi:MAG TPA: carboxypeptidase regulatory-like domain-containing protein [Gemmatimonadales bacterium]|nr:carboxypeptidase regulatory-like domain-containing protein [Gemmatimonadales bacterium]
MRRSNRFWWSGVAVLAGLLLGKAAMTGRAAPPPAAGRISGTVTYTGTPPKMRPIDMSKEPNCVTQHPTPVMTENVVTGAGSTLRWVVVYISAGDQPTSPPTEATRYNQKGCLYIPHVLALQVNQPLDIYNEDPHSHNIHPLARVNPEWNKSQPKGAPPIHTKWEEPEFIPVKCNVHPWMHGYFAVLRTPHYSVTGEDGTFSLAGLPPGKYTVTAWHEQFGAQRQEVTVGDGQSKTISFVFTARPY